ncbi:GIY-YIG nuclease family protein [Dehalobacter sp. DCM]|uniref:GIY-YIG nuclease family protein n=1 Tax=Dehalobacter sp. DCM TaxID=2907827 RepID=UPI0030816F7A|nr:GIY-YIG nuclease family protein [Dehalobacter sp. DCM]
MNIKQLLKEVPQNPGVYRMKDSLGNIIYIGKAKNLRNRVSQYFTNQKNRAPKVVEMIRNIHSFDYSVTDTELDAFLEECRLIKEIKPKYNKLMKNSGSYLYLKIPSEMFPKVTIVNEKCDDHALYFGPFTSRHRVETTVEYLNDFFPIRKCAGQKLQKRTNGCLFMQIGTCLGVCTGKVKPEVYGAHIQKIQDLLNGKDRSHVRELSNRMHSVLKELDYELAAKYLEYASGLNHVIGKQRLVLSSGKNRNTVAVELMNNECAKLFIFKGNLLLFRKVISLTGECHELKEAIRQIILDMFVPERNNQHMMSSDEIDQAQIIYSYLRKNRNIMSFGIPFSYLKRETVKMDRLLDKIIVFKTHHSGKII